VTKLDVCVDAGYYGGPENGTSQSERKSVVTGRIGRAFLAKLKTLQQNQGILRKAYAETKRAKGQHPRGKDRATVPGDQNASSGFTQGAVQGLGQKYLPAAHYVFAG